ncbi:MAG: DUF805 domain-containing protein [Bacteroidales bacterium]|nr:DUF805 domain-containing protein [Clostridium sp.]MCM1203750.1 DUF805 domain-containing protein [Bacteroidales bacterium]
MLGAYKRSWLNSFDFKGRAAKEEWAKEMAPHVIFALLPILIMSYMEWENVLTGLWSFFAACSMIPMLSCMVRRMHDAGKSGWYLLLCMVLSPLVIGFILLILVLKKPSVGENKWGAPSAGEKSSTDSFVDEKLTEEEVKKDNLALLRVILKVIGVMAVIVAGLCVLYYILDEVLLL